MENQHFHKKVWLRSHKPCALWPLPPFIPHSLPSGNFPSIAPHSLLQCDCENTLQSESQTAMCCCLFLFWRVEPTALFLVFSRPMLIVWPPVYRKNKIFILFLKFCDTSQLTTGWVSARPSPWCQQRCCYGRSWRPSVFPWIRWCTWRRRCQKAVVAGAHMLLQWEQRRPRSAVHVSFAVGDLRYGLYSATRGAKTHICTAQHNPAHPCLDFSPLGTSQKEGGHCFYLFLSLYTCRINRWDLKTSSGCQRPHKELLKHPSFDTGNIQTQNMIRTTHSCHLYSLELHLHLLGHFLSSNAVNLVSFKCSVASLILSFVFRS